MRHLPIQCPACKEPLAVKRLACQHCQTQVEGVYDLPVLAQLDSQEQLFLVDFVKSSGSLKEMASLMKLSYPTVRNRLDGIIHKIRQFETAAQEKENNE